MSIRTSMGVCLAGALLAGAASIAAAQDLLAPDGSRGLGAATTLREFHSLLRSKAEADRKFLDELYGLEGGLRVQLALAREHYRKRGWFALIEPRSERDLGGLHAAYRRARDAGSERLTGKNPRARALAEMLSDTRFNVRMALIEGFEFEARELRVGMAVLRATGDGFVILTEQERHAILKRIDLAASLLRALHKDLLVLRPSKETPAEDGLRELLEIPNLRSKEQRAAALRAVLGRTAKRVQQMESALFRPRLLPKLRTLLDWRARQLGVAEPLRVTALTYLPDTPEGQAAPDNISELPKHQRMRLALSTGRQGLASDPLSEELAWAAGFGADFLWGRRESRPYFDRYLALRGIRFHDHRTLKGRDLNEREQHALFVVQQDGPTPLGY